MLRTREGNALTVLARYVEREVRNGLADSTTASAWLEQGLKRCTTAEDMARGMTLSLLLSALLDELSLSAAQRLACRDVIAGTIDADRRAALRAWRRRGLLH